MATVDYCIIFLFLAGFAGYGIWQSRFNRSSEDYFLGSRSVPWPVALFSIVATETSVLTFVSIPGLAYRENWYFLQLALGYILGRTLVSFILLPSYFRRGITSIYQVLGDRFGQSVQRTASVLFLVTRVLADGVRFFATAVIVQAITGWSLSAAVLCIGVITLIYTILGGIRTVVWIDAFQFLIYLAGAVASLLFLLSALDAPWLDSVQKVFASPKSQIFHSGTDLFTDPKLAFSAILGGLLLSLASHGTDHMMVQRALVCKNLAAARKAMIGSGFFVFLQFALFLFLGTLMHLYYSGAALEQDREFAHFIVDALPIGLKGLLLAGVLSAAMSSLSSSINALASSTLVDWLKTKISLKQSRWVSFAWAVILTGIALVFEDSKQAVVVLGLQIASYTYGGLLALFLLSRARRKFHPASLITGLLAGLALVLFLRQQGIAWTWFIGAGAAMNMAIAYLLDPFLGDAKS